ncbi:hypothetical protein [Pseudonocardia sp. HH130630-07]|uniref:hypothetical protein n=1 Tax=Pseudonocardia sp. HH130630-07 TaxID=1690815 RepID=UPI0008152ED2|nr:hypothetical protein [Pseudonocardia sp. HH130630-07]ANY07285.1 hypothetical protein AFB00_14465 [Pseudonocardia sp. HH130630-07]
MRRITRAGLRSVGLLAATGVLCAAAVAPAVADEPGTTWQPDLSTGSGTGVAVDGAGARFDPATAVGAPVEDGGDAEASADPAGVVPTGLLTLEPRTLDAPTREVGTALAADTPDGSSATLDVRGRKANGSWSEWIPATDDRVALPEAVREVQGRLVLTATGQAAPTVREVTLSAAPAAGSEADGPVAEAAPLSYSVFATREGLEGGTTANGHVIAPRDRFVALPSRRALSPQGETGYSVKVCAPNGRCAVAPVWDIGPWNTKDDYWNPSAEREMWKDLPQGLPQAAAAFHDKHNGGKDQFGRTPANPAGIDLGDGLFWDALGLKDNSQVQVDYLWTGSQKLSAVRAEGAADVQILAEPKAGAASVGIAVDTTQVPVLCTVGDFARIDDGQYLPVSALGQLPADVSGCAAPGAPDPADPAPAPGAPATGSTGTPAAPSGDPSGPAASPGDPAASSAGPGPTAGGPTPPSGGPGAPTGGDPAAGPATGPAATPTDPGRAAAGAPPATGSTGGVPAAGEAGGAPAAPVPAPAGGEQQAATLPQSALRAPSGGR